MRERIHREYDGVVLREEIVPDPPVRGMFGYAHIPLQENAVPQRQKPFCMHGERQEAYKKIVLDWIEKSSLRDPPRVV